MVITAEFFPIEFRPELIYKIHINWRIRHKDPLILCALCFLHNAVDLRIKTAKAMVHLTAGSQYTQ